jgi:energy-coupling factor transporter ATP-binding protein EcfA2
MSFAIIETNGDDELMTGSCSSEDELISILSADYEYVLTTAGRPDGDYIVKTDTGYDLVHKSTDNSISFFFGPSTIETNHTIKSWRLIKMRQLVSDVNAISEFNLSTIFKKAGATMLIGKAGAGRSTMVKRLLALTDPSYINNSLVIGSSEYKEEYPNITSIKEWNDGDIDDYIVNVGNNPGVIIIEDSNNQLYHKLSKYTIEYLIYNFKYYNKHLIFVCHHPNSLPAPLAKQFTNVFLFRYSTKYTTELIYRTHCNMFGSYDNFIDVFHKLTDSFKCMIIDKDKGKVFKCPDHF